MARAKEILLGLDPGGIDNFGWCVAEDGSNLPIKILATGKADHAQGAIIEIQKILAYESTLSKVVAVGIDSPLFWISNGDRQADISVRRAIGTRGARNVYGTVQNVNALRGACLVQGVLSARLLKGIYQKIRITESHPKALLWLLDIANRSLPVKEIELVHLSEYLDFHTASNSEHERDAALGALSAWHMMHADNGSWHNLVEAERSPFAPVPDVEYWMPIIPHSKPHHLPNRSGAGTVTLGNEFVQEFKKLYPNLLTEGEEKAIESIIMDSEIHYASDNPKQMFSSKEEFYLWLYSEVSFHAKLANIDFEKAEKAYVFWAKKYHPAEYNEMQIDGW